MTPTEYVRYGRVTARQRRAGDRPGDPNQTYGNAFLSQNAALDGAYTCARFMHMGRGPDQMPLSSLGKQLLQLNGQPVVGG